MDEEVGCLSNFLFTENLGNLVLWFSVYKIRFQWYDSFGLLRKGWWYIWFQLFMVEHLMSSPLVGHLQFIGCWSYNARDFVGSSPLHIELAHSSCTW